MSKAEIEKFFAFWKGEIAKIEKRTLDSRSVFLIQNDFDIQQIELKMFMTEQEFEKRFFELKGLESQLRIALETARCRYDLQSKGLMAKISESIAKIFYNIAEIIKSILRK
jgi:hypothetical protein